MCTPACIDRVDCLKYQSGSLGFSSSSIGAALRTSLPSIPALRYVLVQFVCVCVVVVVVEGLSLPESVEQPSMPPSDPVAEGAVRGGARMAAAESGARVQAVSRVSLLHPFTKARTLV